MGQWIQLWLMLMLLLMLLWWWRQWRIRLTRQRLEFRRIAGQIGQEEPPNEKSRYVEHT